MNTVKLELLFEAYLAYLKERPPDYGLWIGGVALRMGLKHIHDCKSDDDKAQFFLTTAEEAARLMPSWDWSTLSTLEKLPTKLIMSDVYSLVKVTGKYPVDCGKLRNSARHITVLAKHRGLPAPHENKIVETICFLRSLNVPMYRFPFVADIVDRVADFLECDLSPVTDDYLGARKSEQFCEELRDAMKAAFEDKLKAVSEERLKTLSDQQWQDCDYTLLTGHMLKIVRDADLLSKVATIKTDYSVMAKYILFYELYESAKKALEITRREAEFFLKEQAFIRDTFSVGKTVQHRHYGDGVITSQTDRYVAVDFPNVPQKQFELLPAVLNGTLTVDSEELQEHLYFSRDTLLSRKPLLEIYEKALTLESELSSGLPTLSRLLELRPITVKPEALKLPTDILLSNAFTRWKAMFGQ